MTKTNKSSKVFAVILVTSILLMVAAMPIQFVKAQCIGSDPEQPPLPQQSSVAGVVVSSTVGGTTSPVPGSYELESTASTTLTATPDSGYVFSNWLISSTPFISGAEPAAGTKSTTNPYPLSNQAIGTVYYYEAVFTPISSTITATPTPTIPEMPSALVVLLALIFVLAGAFAYTKCSRSR